MKSRPGGNSAAYLMDQLDRAGQADLALAVRSGELTAHSAAVAAGIRKRIVQLPLANPERIAAVLRQHLPDDKLCELVTRVVGLLEAPGSGEADQDPASERGWHCKLADGGRDSREVVRPVPAVPRPWPPIPVTAGL